MKIIDAMRTTLPLIRKIERDVFGKLIADAATLFYNVNITENLFD